MPLSGGGARMQASFSEGDKAMAANSGNSGAGLGPAARLALWGGAGCLLLAPLIAMQFTGDVAWTAFDFAFAGGLLFLVASAFELAARASGSLAYRAGAGLAAVTALLIVWATGAVGIIGSEAEPANLLYFAVLALGLTAAAFARFEAEGMARAMAATAAAHALVGVIALWAGWGAGDPSYPWDIVASTAVFTLLWLVSAALFHRASREARG
jgi:hypothetical protein